MKRFFSSISILSLIFIVVISSCKKEETSAPAGKAVNNFNQPTETLKTLSGFVVDENNVPLAGVTVSAHGQVYTTGVTGYFIFEDLAIPNQRYVLKFQFTGYFPVTRSDAVESFTAPIQVKVGMLPVTANATTDAVTFSSSTGGTLTVGTLINMDFPPDAYMYDSGLPYTGNVTVTATYLDPTDVNYNIRTHGGDQVGKYEGESEEYLLRAFVGVNILLQDATGQKLQLNPNMPEDVNFTFALPAALQPLCPSEIDIWTFDDQYGLRGSTTTNSTTASKEGVTVSGSVGHFSYVSCELAYSTEATVSGYVRNDNGDPIPGIEVKVGESYAITDANGHYIRKVVAGVPIVVGVYNYFGQTYTNNITPYGNTTVDFQTFAEQTFNGHLVDCNGNPVAGNVVITWAGSASSSTYTNDGSFSVEIPTGTGFVDIYAWGNGSDVYLPFLNSGIDQEVVLCPPVPTGMNIMNLTGGPNMASVTVPTFDSKHGYYYYTDETFIDISNGTSSFSVGFNGAGTGTHSPFTINVQHTFDPMGGPWIANTFTTSSVNITNYGPVGGLIEGTFTGIAQDGTQVDVQFSVNRQPDQ